MKCSGRPEFHNRAAGRGEVMGDENQSWFYSQAMFLSAFLSPPCTQQDHHDSEPHLFIQVISDSHLYPYLLTTFNRIHALSHGLEIIHKGMGLVEHCDELSVRSMLVKQK